MSIEDGLQLLPECGQGGCSSHRRGKTVPGPRQRDDPCHPLLHESYNTHSQSRVQTTKPSTKTFLQTGGDDLVDLDSPGWLPYTKICRNLIIDLDNVPELAADRVLWRGLIRGATHHSGACY